MKKYFVALAALALTISGAKAEMLLAEGTFFDLYLSDVTPVGDAENNLVGATLFARGKNTALLAGFQGSIGGNGALHHEQFPGRGGAIDPTPFGADTDSPVDSHFLFSVQLSTQEPDETTVDDTTSPQPGLDSFGPGITGFGGILSATSTLNAPAAETNIAYLVGEFGSLVGHDFSIATQSALGGTDRFSGEFALGVPEPTTAILAALGLAGFVARRR